MGSLNWRKNAACLRGDPEIFFDERYTGAAKRICAGCGVREQCLDYAFRNREEAGVWGGLTADEREAELRAAVATDGRVPLLTVTYTTRARATGASCSAGRTEEGWGVACHSHGSTATTRSRTDAEAAVSRPQQWCSPCADIHSGDAPRVEREED